MSDAPLLFSDFQHRYFGTLMPSRVVGVHSIIITPLFTYAFAATRVMAMSKEVRAGYKTRLASGTFMIGAGTCLIVKP